FMRARKPWSRLRLRLLGWKVRLVAIWEALVRGGPCGHAALIEPEILATAARTRQPRRRNPCAPRGAVVGCRVRSLPLPRMAPARRGAPTAPAAQDNRTPAMEAWP